MALGGDHDGSRLRRSLQLLDGGFSPQIILTGNKQHWEHVLRKRCISCSLDGRNAIFLEESEDTRTDAQLTLQYCRDNNFKKILVVTSPYHSRRTELVFDDIFDGSRIEPLIVSSEKFGRLLPPTDRWWTDRATIEIVWLEFGKILYWELTPFMEFRGEGRKLMLGERGR